MKIRKFALPFAVVCLAGLGLVPILVMFSKSLIIDGRFSMAYYLSILSPRSWHLLRQSLQLSGVTTVLTAAIGMPLGVLLARTDLPWRRLWAVLFTLPFLFPPYITAFCWSLIVSQQGFATYLFGPAASEAFSAWFFGFPGCVVTLVATFMPIVMLMTMTYIRTINPRLEEAARLFAGWSKVITKITIPVIRAGILLAIILVFLLTLGEFSVPMFFRYDVFPVESFIQFSAFYSFGAATAAAIPLAMITFLALLVERIFLVEKSYQLRPAQNEAGPLIRLGALRWWLFACVFLLSFLCVILPFLVLLFYSGSFSIYYSAWLKAGDSLFRSLVYAAIGASLLVILGFLSGYLIHNRILRFWRGIDTLTIFFFALPSPVIGIGLISLWNQPATNFVYGTFLIIILGYLIQYVALTSRITIASLALNPPSLEEAARIVGAGWFRRMGWIVVPLIKRGLVAGWLVGYIFCLRDIGISMMVYPPGNDTLPVRTLTLMANNPTQLIAALCVIMVAATLVPLGTLGLFLKRKG